MQIEKKGSVSVALIYFCLCLIPGAVLAQAKLEMWKDELPIRQPWLRDHLPDNALGYVRIPQLLGLLATPKGNSLDPALRSKANVANILRLKKAIGENVLEYLPMFEDLRIRMLEQHIRSPLEIAFFMSPAPAGLIAVNLDLESNDAFREMLEVFSLIDPSFGLLDPMGDDGIGQFTGTGMPTLFQFDAHSGRLLLHIGPGVNREAFGAMLNGLEKPNDDHRMSAMERSVDDSGQGFFAWLNAERAVPALRAVAPPEKMAEFNAAGLDQISTIGFGWGAANGKSRFAIAVDVMPGGKRDYLPYVDNQVAARAAGDPDAAVILSIPTAAEFTRIESLALQSASEESQQSWLDGKASFKELTGITPEELLDAIGPEVVLIFDMAGDYVAIRLRNRALWNQTLDRLAAKTGSPVVAHKVAGKTYFHWDLPGELSLLANDEGESLGDIAELFSKQRDHYYWTIDGDFLYMASVPQILIDRASYDANTNVGDWLLNTHRIDASNALFSIVSSSNKLPKRLYAAYIGMLEFAGDIADADLDIWSMPTAKQLNLPDKGTVGFTIKLGNPTVAAEFTMENNPLEVLAGGGAVSVAVVGILAAIAIPAYQDYSIRAKVSEGLSIAGGQKAAVTEYYQDNGRFPDADAAKLMSQYENAGQSVWSVIVEPGTGMIVIEYNEDVGPDGGRLFLQPSVNDGLVEWSCSGSFADKRMPAACRNSDLPFEQSDGA